MNALITVGVIAIFLFIILFLICRRKPLREDDIHIEEQSWRDLKNREREQFYSGEDGPFIHNGGNGDSHY